jgi:hypothetical protein
MEQMAVENPRDDLPKLFLTIEFLRLLGTAFANVPASNTASDRILARMDGAVRGHFPQLRIFVFGGSSLVVLSRY